MTPRKPLNRVQVILLCQRQALAPILCGCGCGEPLEPVNERVIDEHVLARKLAEAGNEGERDSLENRALYRLPCALKKTATQDQPRIAKARRQGGETGQRARREKRGKGSIPHGKTKWPSRKLEGRGFEKRQKTRTAVDEERGGYGAAKGGGMTKKDQ